ncbi:hypothetical protein CAEBREN_10464 [Caenorhabditis brenneri]|uniref:BTB domain-containing protein n=1 Tax=Caenorhabditis brenneri TaxID=135651 RepID=G0MVW8_CAEBE|nr:hypothetical protein CAEBREN_10464 [Caenorhabditis brenneri]
MTETSKPSIYESTFAKSDKTDAVLVVDGKKLHVNKACNKLNLCSKSPTDSFFQPSNEENVENVLELADRFSILSVTFYLEPFLTAFSISVCDDIRIGDKYGMTDLIEKRVARLSKEDFKTLAAQPFFESLSDDTKSGMLYRYMNI